MAKAVPALMIHNAGDDPAILEVCSEMLIARSSLRTPGTLKYIALEEIYAP